jgi:phosphatidate cytidylyltransferase
MSGDTCSKTEKRCWLGSRIISGLVMAGGIIAVLVLGDAWVMYLVASIIALIAAFEYHSMAAPDASIGNRSLFVLCALALGLQPLINISISWPLNVALSIVFLFTAVRHLTQPLPLNEAADRLSRDILGLMYLGSTLPFIILLRGLDGPESIIKPAEGGWVLLMVIIVTALSDTGGYFAGRAFGKHKLFEAVSPKKTIEGAIGGFVCAIGGCFIMQMNVETLHKLTVQDCIAIGVLGTVASIIGDLVESLVKRGYGVKDSGSIIPGHGGVLDRVDALLFSAPVIFFYWGACIA